MTEENTTTDLDIPADIKPEDIPKWAREQIKQRDEELATLRKERNKDRMKLLESAFEAAGLDPTKGIGKAVAEKYDGDPDPSAIQAFAADEYSWEPPAANALADEVRSAQGRVESAAQGTSPLPTQQIDLDIQKAEERGDFASLMALKVQKYRDHIGM